MDWNDWIGELVRALEGQHVLLRFARHWGHIRWAYKQGQTPQEVAEWVRGQSVQN